MEANKTYVIHGSLALEEAVTKVDHDALKDRVDELETSETSVETRLTNLEKQKILTGEIDNISVGSHTYKDITIPFNPAFAKAPKVFTQLETYPSASDPAYWENISVYVISTTTNNCLIRVFNNSGTSYSSLVVHWAAIYDGN